MVSREKDIIGTKDTKNKKENNKATQKNLKKKEDDK